MSVEIASLISIFGGAKDLGIALINERDRQKAATIQIDFSEKIIEAQAQLSEVLGTVIEKDRVIQTLSERIRDLETKQNEKARYHLAKLGIGGNFFAYRLRPSGELIERNDEPEHFLCQPCFDAGKKGILVSRDVYGATSYRCPICKEDVCI